MFGMRRSSGIVMLLLAVCLSCPAAVFGDGSKEALTEEDGEQAAIRDAVETKYITGLKRRDFSLIEEICIPEAMLMGTRDDGEFHITTLERWSKRFDPESPPFKRLDFVISRIDRVGTAAQVRIDFTVDSTRHVTDFLNMVRVDGRWRIVNIIDY